MVLASADVDLLLEARSTTTGESAADIVGPRVLERVLKEAEERNRPF